MLPLQENNPAVAMWRERSRIRLFLRLALSSPMLAPLFSVSPGFLEAPGPEPPRDSALQAVLAPGFPHFCYRCIFLDFYLPVFCGHCFFSPVLPIFVFFFFFNKSHPFWFLW